MKIVDKSKMFGGHQLLVCHNSESNLCEMHFSLFIPEGDGPFPVLYFLAGLTSNWENASIKSGIQRYASECGLVIVFPDTSPRGENIPDRDEWWLGHGAGYYVNATEEPFVKNYQMESYIVSELPQLVGQLTNVSRNSVGVTGFSMGGHGALTLAMKNPDIFRSVSALSPISSTLASAWGQAVFPIYLGKNSKVYSDYDATALMKTHGWGSDILVDQGGNDDFLKEHLRPDLLKKAADENNISLTLNIREGYDHSYWFVSTFVGQHVAWHSAKLT